MGDARPDRYCARNPIEATRRVPLPILLHVVIGGYRNQFWWLFFGFSLYCVWVFGGASAFYKVAFLNGELAVTEGVVTQIVDAHLDRDETPIDRYCYQFHLDGISYQGAVNAVRGSLEVDQTVSVEYKVSNPMRSRIKEPSLDDGVSVIPLLLASIGFYHVAGGLRKGLRAARLLRIGKQGRGKLISFKKSFVKINGQSVYKYTFAFEAEDGKAYRVKAKSLLERGFGHELLYNPDNPRDAIMLDELPGEPRIGNDNRVECEIPRTWMILVIPGLTILGHGWWFLHVLQVV